MRAAPSSPLFPRSYTATPACDRILVTPQRTQLYSTAHRTPSSVRVQCSRGYRHRWRTGARTAPAAPPRRGGRTPHRSARGRSRRVRRSPRCFPGHLPPKPVGSRRRPLGHEVLNRRGAAAGGRDARRGAATCYGRRESPLACGLGCDRSRWLRATRPVPPRPRAGAAPPPRPCEFAYASEPRSPPRRRARATSCRPRDEGAQLPNALHVPDTWVIDPGLPRKGAYESVRLPSQDTLVVSDGIVGARLTLGASSFGYGGGKNLRHPGH